MKKLLAILLACVVIFTFSACTNSEVKDAEDKLESVAEDAFEGDVDLGELEDSVSEYVSAIEGNVKGFDDINDYIDAVKASSTYKDGLVSMEQSGMTMELVADGNNLVYRYTYTVPVADNAAELISQSIEENPTALKTSADAIRIEAPCVEKVLWEYYTTDGELIISFEE